ncbi:MAG: hypothetical protein COA79_05200 [Planctomycetota bacterium]|nr:MAG: hypothetical protein COA79_05200 [Planctomycetota bacterium]
MKILSYLLLFLLATSCGDKIQNISKKQLNKSYEIAKDSKKPIDQRITAFIFLKQKSHFINLDSSKKIAEFIKKNESFFHKKLFNILIKDLSKSKNEILILSSYDYQIGETVKLKNEVIVYSEKPKEISSIKDIEAASALNEKSIVKLPPDTEIKVIKKNQALKEDLLLIQTSNKKTYYCYSYKLKGNSFLKNELKAKSIWLANYFIKNYGNKDSFMFFTYLVEEFKLNVNRKLTSNYQYIHKAVQRGTEAEHFVKYLIKKKALLNGITAFEETPLDLAYKNKAIYYHAEKKSTSEKEEYKRIKKQKKKFESLINTLVQNGAKSYIDIKSNK